MWFSEEGAESQLWGWHNDKATPTLRDTPEGQVDRIWTQKHTSTVVILRDQIEDRPLHWVWSNIPEWSSKLMIGLGWNQPNDISSGHTIWPQVRWYDLKENKPWHQPIIECFASEWDFQKIRWDFLMLWSWVPSSSMSVALFRFKHTEQEQERRIH